MNIDRFDGTLTIADSIAFAPAPPDDQIELMLSKAASGTAISGSFGYLDGGVLVGAH